MKNYKAFSERATILLGGPYAKYDDPSKISAFLSWTGDKGFQLYKNIDWERTGYDKSKWEDVVKAFWGKNSSLARLLCSPGINWAIFIVHTVRIKLSS